MLDALNKYLEDIKEEGAVVWTGQDLGLSVCVRICVCVFESARVRPKLEGD